MQTAKSCAIINTQSTTENSIMYKLELIDNKPVMVFEADKVLGSVYDLIRAIYVNAGETLENADYWVKTVEYFVYPDLYHDGYKVDYPFNPLDMFQCKTGPNHLRVIAISMEEAGIALAFFTEDGKIHLCYQSEEDWSKDQEIANSHYHNPYMVLKHLNPSIGWGFGN